MISTSMFAILGGFCICMCSSLRGRNVFQTLQTPHSSTVQSSATVFTVYWNVPSKKCDQYKVYFEPTLKNLGIKYNDGLNFTGEKIILLYDPGNFPIVNKKGEEENGGIPQCGDINKHKVALEKAIKDNVPAGFNGVGIIDFEVWRPIFRQNYNAQVKYRNMSIDKVLKNTSLPYEKAKIQAGVEFEEKAREFMEETLKVVKTARPNAVWGYYGFPYCYNQYEADVGNCAELAVKDNNRTQWLFDASSAFYPSVYMNESITGDKVSTFVSARLIEARRLWDRKTIPETPLVLPYFWHLHKESNASLSKENVEKVIKTIKSFDMGGVIIWARSEDLGSKQKCEDYLKFIQERLGPAIQSF